MDTILGATMTVKPIPVSNEAEIEAIRRRIYAARFEGNAIGPDSRDTAMSRMRRRLQLLDDLRNLGWDAWVNQGKEKEFETLTGMALTPFASSSEAR
jgi:hypothetical protein